MTIIDSQFYIFDSLSLDVSLEWNANLVIAWLWYLRSRVTIYAKTHVSTQLNRRHWMFLFQCWCFFKTCATTEQLPIKPHFGEGLHWHHLFLDPIWVHSTHQHKMNKILNQYMIYCPFFTTHNYSVDPPTITLLTHPQLLCWPIHNYSIDPPTITLLTIAGATYPALVKRRPRVCLSWQNKRLQINEVYVFFNEISLYSEILLKNANP